MKIFCKEPCTFVSGDSPIRIYDEKGKIFYYHPNKEKAITFNLPIGQFETKNTLIQKNFKPYEAFIKPKNFISPNEFQIIIGDNPKKATITIPKRTILFDKKIAYHEYKPCTVFVLGHELAHTWLGGNKVDDYGFTTYNAEKMCDDFAKNWMLSHGYNPTQIKFAVDFILSCADRKKCIHENTINQNFRR